MTISLDLTGDAERQLADTAKRLNVPVRDSAAAAVRDLLARPVEDSNAPRRISFRLTKRSFVGLPECGISHSGKLLSSTDEWLCTQAVPRAFGTWGP